jgi:hypothetical protein
VQTDYTRKTATESRSPFTVRRSVCHTTITGCGVPNFNRSASSRALIFKDQDMRYLGKRAQYAVSLRPQVDDRPSLTTGQIGKCSAMVGMVTHDFGGAMCRPPLVKEVFGICDLRRQLSAVPFFPLARDVPRDVKCKEPTLREVDASAVPTLSHCLAYSIDIVSFKMHHRHHRIHF